MKQYCRYCASLCNGDALYCDSRDLVLSEAQIKRPNNCEQYAYCGFDENGFEHTPREYRRKVKVDNIALFE